jgi:hypothetical protein
VQACLIGLIVLCVVGSVISVIGWIRRSRTDGGGRHWSIFQSKDEHETGPCR